MRKCVHCGDTEDEWGRDSVILGEITRGDINAGLWKEDPPRPICSRSCLQAEMDDHVPPRDARFGGPGWRDL